MSQRLSRFFRSPLASHGWVTIVGLLVAAMTALVVIMTPAEAEQQAWVAMGGFMVFLIANRLPGRGATIFLTMLSSIISLRYMYWRVTETLGYASFFETFLGTGLLLAELYAVLVLVLSYYQGIWPLERKPVPLPDDPDLWPEIDVFIPSYNEPLAVVKPTVFGALAMDWPRHKMNIYILDDGRREDFRAFAEQVGCGYIIRPDNKGAKAGNINHALTRTGAPYVVIFDCDHVPTRAFLQLTIGWMERDAGIGMLQTPHHFYSPDPFERNLASGQRVPNEGLLFYGLVQQGNDLWNATFFCGSCAVIRRTALEEVGGVPTQTVTEDCHCSLKMQRLGWRTAYLRIPLAAGLATDRLISHIGQRMRWARGMLQILRVDSPLTGHGLTFAQRMCYLNAQLHYLFPVPRFVFLTAPLAFLLMGQSIIAASPLAIVAYAAPHIVHSVATNSRIQGRVRHSFWSEIYETVLALWLLPVVVTTLLDPKKGKFNVTDKGGVLSEGYFDMRAVGPNFVLALFLLGGLSMGVYGMIANGMETLDFQAYALNSIWVVLSFVVVLAGLAVGRERRQVRERARIHANVPALIILPDGRVIEGESLDLSLGGAAILADAPPDLPAEDNLVNIQLEVGPEFVTIPAEVMRWQKDRMQVRFVPQDIRDEGNITRAVLGRADAWVDWDMNRPDDPLRSLGEVALSIGGLFRGDSQLSLFARRSRGRKAAARPAEKPPEAPSAERLEPKLSDSEELQRRARARAAAKRTAAGLLLALSLAAPALAQNTRNQAPPPPPPLNRPAQAPQQQAPAASPLPSLPPLPALGGGAAAGGAASPLLQAPPLPAFDAAPAQAQLPGLMAPAMPAGPLPGQFGAGAQAPVLFGAGDTSGPGPRIEARTLRQLGLRSPMQLRGLSDLQGILFGIRGDEVVTGAKLVLQGATSPALIPELSQIAITLNEQFVGTIQPDRSRPAFGPLEFPINPVFFADNNRLNFRFTGRYAVECNDPLSGLLWSTVSDLSTLHLTLERLPMARDLARLPEPFFDPRQLREPLNLPIVLQETASNEVLKAATVATSWFAVQADYRGSTFPVTAALPQQGNAIVIATGSESVPDLPLPRMDGPTLALVPNPNDQNGLLLVVGGRTGAEALVAAQALAVGKEALAGEVAVVTAPTMPPRQPYDAPRWVRSDRPVRLGELVDPSELQSYGFAPGAVSIPFRTAPDLYTWRERPLPVDLKFRSPPGPVTDVAVSRLDVSLNDVYLKSFPLREGEQGPPWSWISRYAGLPIGPGGNDFGQGRAGLPPYLVFGLNELQLRFDMRPLNRGDCISIPGDIRASIDPDSTIDLSSSYRFTRLPNLAFFAGSGFPFTRLADFSGTTVVLPERPNALELSAYLTLVGKLAANVGHPATKIEVVRPGALAQTGEKDLLVVGALGRQPAIGQLLADSPIQLEGNRITVGLPDQIDNFRNLFLGDDRRLEREKLQTMLASPGDGMGVMIGAPNPHASSRSILVLTGTTPQAVEAMVAALRDPEQLPHVQGDLALLSGGRVSSFKVGKSYTVGSLPLWLWPQWWLSSRPELLLVMMVVAALIAAVPAYWALRRRAALRLRTRT